MLSFPNKPWIAYLIAIIGILISCTVWYVLWRDLEAYFHFLMHLHSLTPWLALILGCCFSILIAVVIRVAQLAQSQAATLKETNETIKREIADRIFAEETKQKLEVALLQGQKLQAIGTLAGGIAHDFNNILYAIIGYTEMAQEDVAKDGITYKNLGKVKEAAHRGQELISRILAFSRRQHHEFDVIQLKESIEAALSLLTPTIPASVMIDFKAQNDTDFSISGNQTQVHQILVNLINNAVDAMESEGSITIHLDRVPAADPLLRQFPELRTQDYCRIEISDQGHGMDRATMERIFEPFFTTKEVGKGSGLGLSIVHSIVKEHHGDITVKSQLGHGTTFMLLLPTAGDGRG
ncbi:MAG TPA: ATP-binding protein [Gammaproteobacteria bacterium]|jgi:signal transduction histidine kinase|nr:ATP-binding protein [Gammaproteobacteria bacterium]